MNSRPRDSFKGMMMFKIGGIVGIMMNMNALEITITEESEMYNKSKMKIDGRCRKK